MRDEQCYGDLTNLYVLAIVGPFAHNPTVLMEPTRFDNFMYLSRFLWPSLATPPIPAPSGWLWVHGDATDIPEWYLLRPFGIECFAISSEFLKKFLSVINCNKVQKNFNDKILVMFYYYS